MLPELNWQRFKVSLEGSVNVTDRIMMIVFQTLRTRIFLRGDSFGVLSLDEDVAGSSVDIEVVVHACDFEG